MPHPPQHARLPLRRVRRLRPLGRPARPRQARRPAARGASRRRDPARRVAGDGPDRARLEELAGSKGLDGRVTFAGRVSDDELTDLYARCLAVYYAPVDEDFGMVPFEAFLAEKPVVTTVDAGGPLEVVADRRTGLVCEPRARCRSRGLRLAPRPRGRRPHVGAGGPSGRGAGDVGPRDRPPPRMKVAYYSPLPPSRSGDRRLQRAAAARAGAADRRRDRPARPLPPHPEGRRRPLPRRQRSGSARLDRRSAAPPARRRRPPRDRPAPPRRGDHPRPRRRGRLPGGDGARSTASPAACSPTASSTTAFRRCGRRVRRTSRSRARS